MAAAASNFSSLLFLTLLGFSSIFGSSYGFPYHGQRLQGNVQRAAPSDDMGAAFGAQQIPPPQQQTSNEPLTRVPLPQQPESTDLQQPNGVQQPQQPLQPEPTDLQQPNGVQQPQPETTDVQQPSPAEPIPAPESSSNMGISENVEPIPAPESTDVEPIYGMQQQQQSPPAESVEISIFEPMDNETDSAQAIVETLTEAERSHLISYFLCEMCKELQVSMCMRICNGETDGSGSGAEIESSGAEVEGSGQESSENGGETIIIVVEEGSGQESSNGSEGSGQESSSGSEGSGQESSNGSEGSGESEESGDN